MNWIIRQTVDLARGYPNIVVWQNALMMPGDNLAHTWEVEVKYNGQVVDLTGYTVSATLERDDNVGVYIEGSIIGNVALVVFSPQCYAISGPLRGVFSLANTSSTITIAETHFTVRHKLPDQIVDPGDVIPSLQELLAGEAERKANEVTRQSNEQTRQDNESGRVGAEDTRQSQESARQSAESARSGAEQTRASNETTRINKENQRQSAETSRANAESARLGNESTRQSNETTRLNSESARQTREGQRQSAENIRVSNEADRQSNETTRLNSEDARVLAEQARALAETERQENEEDREAGELARNTKLGNLTFGITMIAPSDNPHAEVTQDEDSIDAELFVPTSNLAYATFEIMGNKLYMSTPEGFDDINFGIDYDNRNLYVEITA